jgi:hypothetical protein
MDMQLVRAARYFGEAVDYYSKNAPKAWRHLSRCHIDANLPSASYKVHGLAIRVFKSASFEYLVSAEMPLVEFPDVTVAHYTAKTVLAEFLERTSICCYGKAFVLEDFSTAPCSVLRGEKFKMLLPYANVHRTAASITNEDIAAFDVPEYNKHISFARHLVSKSINETSIEAQFFSAYSALERIADLESTETIKIECANCGHVSESGRKKTATYLRDLLVTDGVDKKTAAKITSLRGQIAHGAYKITPENLLEWSRLSASTQSIALGVIAERCEVKIRNSEKLVAVEPHIILDCSSRHDGAFSVDGFFVNTKVLPARLTRGVETLESISAVVGLATASSGQIPVKSLCWPTVACEQIYQINTVSRIAWEHHKPVITSLW